jgi:hypothetical protein
MLGRLRRRQVRKKPKRLRALHSRSSGPWLHLGWRRKTSAALGESALGRAFTARCRRRAPRGPTSGKRQGIIRPRKGRVILRRARTRRTWMCPYAVVSLQKSIGGSDPQKPFPQTQSPVRALGGRGERGLGHWMYKSAVNVASDHGAPHVRSLTMRRPDVPRGARGDKEPKTRAGCGCNHGASGPQENPKERSAGETWGQRVRNRRLRGRSKSSAFPVDRRRLGPGKATPCHDGGVEAVSAAVAESVNQTRTAKQARTGIERRSRQGCQRYDHAGEWPEDNATTIPAGSAEAMRSVVKRSHPRSRWAATRRVHAR